MLDPAGEQTTFTWVGHVQEMPARVYALAFTRGGEIVVVRASLDMRAWWLPGGGVEPDESPEEALRRELCEEAGAAVEALQALGSQRVEHQHGMRSYHRFYWCRVSLDPTGAGDFGEGRRRLVGPKDLLDTLEWGRSDPAAGLILDLAREVDGKYR